VVVAVEDHFGIVVAREQLESVCAGGATLLKLAHMIENQGKLPGKLGSVVRARVR